jgi:hypothetical protein
MLFAHWIRRAASRAAWMAGMSSATKMAMIAMTTSSSTSVKAGRHSHVFLPLAGPGPGREMAASRQSAAGWDGIR